MATACIGARVRIINRKITRIYDDALRPLGIKFTQLNILSFITLKGPTPAFEIVNLLSIEKSTLSRNLAILETNDWVKYVSSGRGNTRNLLITRSGGALLKRATPIWAEAQAKVELLLGGRTTKMLMDAELRIRDGAESN